MSQIGAALFAAVLSQFPSDDQPLPNALAKVVPGVTMEEVPLRRAVNRLAAANGAAVVFGRDVDPTAPVTLNAGDLTVAGALDAIVVQADAAAVPVGGAVFVGPPGELRGGPRTGRTAAGRTAADPRRAAGAAGASPRRAGIRLGRPDRAAGDL